MQCFAVKGNRFQLAMRSQQDRAAGSLVNTMRFHPYQAVFDQVNTPNAMLATNLIEFFYQVCR